MAFQSSASDSPLKNSSATLPTSGRPTMAKDVVIAVHQDLDKAVGVIPASEFMEKFLPADKSVLNAVTLRIMSRFFDNKKQQWREFPTNDADLERNFYKPFVTLANAVAEEIKRYPQFAAKGVQGKWRDCHTETPRAGDSYTARIRPDCAFISNEEVVKAFSGEQDQNVGEKHPRTEEGEEKVKLWWRQIIIPVELKRKQKDHVGIFPQLCTYIRQIFREQLDRRFVFGITLTYTQVAVWLCDRSGALGMSTCYNINKSPNEFIHILAAASLLSGPQLGWDPTLKLCDSLTQNFDFSYRIRPLQTVSQSNLSDSKWLLSMVDEETIPNKQHKIILAGSPLIFRSAEGMNGRAVQVHRGYLEEDKDKTYRSPLVVKTSWQPASKLKADSRPHEAYNYSVVEGIKDRIFAASVVKANHGWSDTQDRSKVSTLEYIRREVETDFDEARKLNNTMKVEVLEKLDEMDEPFAFMLFKKPEEKPDYIRFAEDESRLTDRVQTRIVMNVWGWPLKYFIDLTELLEIMLGAIEEHKKMYEAGLLHRDVSAGNILIRPASPSRDKDLRTLVSTTSGALIDLDHTKYTTDKAFPGKGVVTPPSDHLQPYIQILRFKGCYVKEDVVAQCQRLLPDPSRTTYYIDETMERNVMNSSPSGPWSAKDLGWKDVGERPDFTSHRPTVNERTGTVPFISYKLMNRHLSVIHEAIHDLESFWWIIVYFCLTRQSGGGHRRADFNKKLLDLLKCLFHGGNDTIGFGKFSHFDQKDNVPFERLLEHFHPYFNPLKPMLRRWRNVLILGYLFKAYEYYLVHDFVIEIIKDTLSSIREEMLKNNIEQKLQGNVAEAIRQELERREEDYSRICNVPLSSNPLTSHVSPPSSPISVASGGISPPRPTRQPYGPPRPPATTVAQEPSSPTPQSQRPPQSSSSHMSPLSKKPRKT